MREDLTLAKVVDNLPMFALGAPCSVRGIQVGAEVIDIANAA
ncbi:hypothetical protein [Microvirga sp. G4-2]